MKGSGFGIAMAAALALMPVAFVASAADVGIALEPIRDQQAVIREGVLARVGPYRALSDDTRLRLLERQARLFALLDGKRTAAELAPEQRVEAFNLLEWIEGAINRTPGDRMVCERTRKTGSNRIARVCRTEREIRQARERARRQMEGSMPIGI